MKLLRLIVTLLLLACASVAGAAPAPTTRAVLPFDSDWRFFRGDAAGAQNPAFDDSGWRSLSVPHDWAIEGSFDPHALEGGAGAFLPTGTGWYRKHFSLPAADAGRRVSVDFDGIMANSDVWINGFHLGHRPNGYVSLYYDLTGHLRFGPGQANVLAVRADNSQQPASRWYAGAGIDRHVRLVVTNPMYLEHWATFITTPQVSPQRAQVQVATTIVNDSAAARRVSLQITLRGPDGATVGTSQSPPQNVPAGGSADYQATLTVTQPRLWDIDHPMLYHAETRVQSEGGATLDSETTPFGIRAFRFDAATGFWLNGRNLKIKGVCLHADGGAVGTAVPLGIWRRRLTLLKQLGVNAIRTSHDPVAPEFLDLCDQMGFVVMSEYFDCWTVGKEPYDYHLYFRQWSATDARDTIRRDRNHPCIVLYSAGNEIRDTTNAPLAKNILASLLAVYHANDPTRPVTQALFRPNASHDYDDGLADMLDVVGQNYRENELLAAHAAVPTRKIIGTENGHARAEWLALRDNPPLAGEFLWTGVDYLGEARAWPTIGSASGLIDRTGLPRPRAFQRQSWWSDMPMVAIARVTPQPPPAEPGGDAALRAPQDASDWTPANLAPHTEDIEVYSNCEQVELLLNGASLGSKPLPADAAPRVWQVPFAPGTLRAVGSNGGTIVATQELHTAGPPVRLVLEADQSVLPDDFDDVSDVRATVVDAAGVPVPSASDLVTFAVSGPGSVAAVDNGDIDDTEPFHAVRRHAYAGHCLAIVRSTAASGQIVLTASAPGLAPASLTLTAAPGADKSRADGR